MHPRIQAEFDELFERYPPAGKRVLELGVSPNPNSALLPSVARRNPTAECIGVNLTLPQHIKPDLPYRLVEGSANDLSMFENGSVDAVISNAMLEHDRAFWVTLAEVRRILSVGGLFYLGVPGYRETRSLPRRLLSAASKSQLRRSATAERALTWLSGTRLMATTTYAFHAAPEDYWRFSPTAVESVLLEGMERLHVSEVLSPVRLIAVGRKLGGPTAGPT